MNVSAFGLGDVGCVSAPSLAQDTAAEDIREGPVWADS
jgi:hypothetical protein